MHYSDSHGQSNGGGGTARLNGGAMRAVRLDEPGVERLGVRDVAEPEVPTGWVRVAIRAAALNHRDVFIAQGLYPNIRLPCTLGADGAGELDGGRVVIDPTLGWGADEAVWQPTASILGMPVDGTFAERVAVPRDNVHPMPDHLSFEEAAALPLAGVTAFRAAFSRGRLREGETVLITGVGGGVQTFALLFAIAAGARAVVTSGSDDKLERAKSLGAAFGVNHRTNPAWQKELRQHAGTIDLAIDSAGGETFAKAMGAVRPGGRMVTYGGTAGDTSFRMFPLFWNQLTIMGTSMGSPADFAAMLQFVRDRRIRPIVDRTYDLDDVRAAAARMEEAAQFGKLVLRVA